MIGLDVGDHRDVGCVLQQRAIAFVGFGDETVATAVMGVGTGLPSSPPTAKDGSSPQCCRATISMDVVVVLPCVPVTINVVRPAINLASTAGRSTTGMPRRLASTSSGLVWGWRHG